MITVDMIPVARPPVPAEIKRLLRKEAGFGCCRCGHPIFQYHHIIPYAERQMHVPEDMMILCPNCHDSATQGAFPVDEQRKWKTQPFNIQNGSASGKILTMPAQTDIALGGNYFLTNGALIRVEGEPLIATTYEDGILLLSVNLYDQEDNLVSVLEENEWVANASLPWDIQAGYKKLKIRQADRKILISIDASSPHVSINGELWRKGERIELKKDGIRIDGVIQNFQMIGCDFYGCSINIDKASKLISIGPSI